MFGRSCVKSCFLVLGIAAATGGITGSLDAAYQMAATGRVTGIFHFDSWRAPARAKKITNPIPLTPASVQAGEVVYTQNCVACHGANAQGDGPTGAFLSPHPANLTKASVWAQGEGAIFWKISHGHSPMPEFADSLSRKQRWNVINYLKKSFDPAGAGK